jgi:trigger factor
MDVEIQEVAPCRKQLTVELAAGEVDEIFENTLNELTQMAQLPGFRKGRVPRRVLERRFGDEIVEDVKSKAFQKGFSEALKENELSPLGEPDIDLDTLEPARGTALKFTTEIDVRPQFELKDYTGLPLEEDVETVTEAQIDERLEGLRERFADQKEVDRPAQAGDLVEGDVTVTAGDETLFDDEERAVRIEGTEFLGYEVGDLEAILGGVTPQTEKTYNFEIPQTHPNESLQGQTATAIFRVKKVLEAELPELDDAFAGRIGMASLENLRDQIKQSMENDRRNAAREDLERQAVDKLIEANPFDLPEGAVQRLAEANLENVKQRLQYFGLPEDQIEERAASMAEESRAEAERTVRRTILFDAIAEKEEIAVTERDFHQHLNMLAGAYNTTPSQILRQVQERDGMGSMQAEIRDIKVTQFLIDNASIQRGESEESTEAAAEAGSSS